MKITGRVSKVTAVRQADKYRRYAEQCREVAKPLSGQFKQTLEEMAKVWDDLVREVSRARSCGDVNASEFCSKQIHFGWQKLTVPQVYSATIWMITARLGVVFAMFASPRGCGVYAVEAGLEATAEVSDDAGELSDGDIEDSPPDAPA
jgi:hypothetical protein